MALVAHQKYLYFWLLSFFTKNDPVILNGKLFTPRFTDALISSQLS